MFSYECIYRISNNCFDENDRLSMTAILDIAQTVAGVHANNNKVGYADFINRGLAWFVIDNKFTIYRNPVLNEELKIVTAPHQSGRFFCIRDYFFYDMDGNLIIKGTSKWVIFDLNKSRITLSNFVFEGQDFIKPDCFAYQDDVNKLTLPEEKFTKILTHKVVKSDLDHYHHFNNTKYLNLFYDGCLINNNESISSFQIDYINQCKEGDNVELYSFKNNNIVYLKGTNGDQVAFQAQIELNS